MKTQDFDFRVWDISKKIYYNNLQFSIMPSDKNTFSINLGIVFAKNLESASMLSSNYEVELYTGFKDKNNAKIYEGDIVSFEVDSHDMGLLLVLGEVIFENGRFVIKGYERMFPHYSFYDFVLKDEGVTIKGNIHENPELLGGEK
ncbi:YopX family protein [uncultured Helicobacter sp.]|uniref:YopX family protein n=1 Tax=uncultured Helicobacter sp. TaxID=175537 RepID=UPI00261D0733|nr:YopX family protein [uncultured Helicobacter sp.]